MKLTRRVLRGATRSGYFANGQSYFDCAECGQRVLHVGPVESLPEAVGHHRGRDCSALGTKLLERRAWMPGDPQMLH